MPADQSPAIPLRMAEDGVYEVAAVDLFCGAGGTSTGLVLAVERLEARYGVKVRLKLVAVNHWPVAIETHSANHKFAQHHCNSLSGIDPDAVLPGILDLLVASPECTHHSNARGGKPMDDQSRSSGNDVLRWVMARRPRSVMLENVREWRSWGPLNAANKPIKSRKGEYYHKFLADLRAIGYTVDDRLINAADHGDPTTRIRLFVAGRRLEAAAYRWPAPTHAKAPAQQLLAGLQKWQTARERVIDWTDLGTSIFNRKKPLSRNTMRRIEAGLYKFSNLDLRGWLVTLYGTSKAGATADAPAPTVTGGGQHIGVAVPFQIRTDCAGGKTAGVRGIDDPAATVVGSGGLGLVQPEAFLLGQQTPATPRSVDDPVPTVAAKGAISKVEPFMVAHFGEREGQDPRVHSVDDPTPAVTSRGAAELAQPFIAEYHGGPDAAGRVRSTDEPLPTQTTEPRFGLAQPFMATVNHGEDAKSGKSDTRVHDVDGPAPVVTGSNGTAMIQPFLLSAGGPEVAPRSIEDPANTVLTRDHMGLATPFLAGTGGPTGSAKPQSVDDPLKTVLPDNHKAFIIPVTHVERPGSEPRSHSVDAPLPTVTTARRGEIGVATAFLVQYNGTAEAKSVEEPVGTLTSKPRYALLVTFQNGDKLLLDILFRMLRPRELARAQGFPDSYQFKGKTEDVVRQIGNAVPVHLAAALCEAALA